MTTKMLVPFAGTLQSIRPMADDCCTLLAGIRNPGEYADFTISPDTYVIQETRLRPGMPVTAFYDPSAPVPLIYPPRYRALMIGRRNPNETIAAEYFDEHLENRDQTLRLNLSPGVEIVSSLGQPFSCPIQNHFLIVYYSFTTRSLPAQTTPRKIIVLCKDL